jgi:ribA/ribD-fused uncharacterized protein
MYDPQSHTREALAQAVEQGQSFKFLFFWGHTPNQPGVTDKSCLSQWYPASFVDEHAHYDSAEHYMMAGKARLFGDEEMLARILAAETPAAAKKLGRQVRGFVQEQWAAHCVEIVTRGNVLKFEQDRALGDFLRSTRGRVLVEASPRDRIWGIGMGARNPKATDPRLWRGQNLLGLALMQARAQIS